MFAETTFAEKTCSLKRQCSQCLRFDEMTYLLKQQSEQIAETTFAETTWHHVIDNIGRFLKESPKYATTAFGSSQQNPPFVELSYPLNNVAYLA